MFRILSSCIRTELRLQDIHREHEPQAKNKNMEIQEYNKILFLSRSFAVAFPPTPPSFPTQLEQENNHLDFAMPLLFPSYI